MFLIQDSIQKQLSKRYSSSPKPSTALKPSFSNLITLKDENNSSQILYIECFESKEKLLFKIMQNKVLYSNRLTTLSKVIPLESDKLNFLVGDVSGIKIDIVPSKSQAHTYAVLILIKRKETQLTSLLFVMKIFTDGFDSLQRVQIGQILPFFKTVKKLTWMPPLLPQFNRYIIEMTDSQIAVHEIRQNFDIFQSFSFDFFGEIESNLVGYDFMEILKPFNQLVMVILEKNGTVIFGSMLARQMLDNQYIKIFLKHYFRGNSIQGDGKMIDFLILARENNIKDKNKKREYTSLKVINFNKYIYGISFLILTSFQKVQKEKIQMIVQVFLLKIDKNKIQLLPLVTFRKNAESAQIQILSDQVDDKKAFILINSDIWVIDFTQIIVHKSKIKTFTLEQLRKCIKIEKNISIEHNYLRVLKQTKQSIYHLSFCKEKVQFEIIPAQTDKQTLQEGKKIVLSKIQSILEQEQYEIYEYASNLSQQNVEILNLASLDSQYSYLDGILQDAKSEFAENMSECRQMLELSQKQQKKLQDIFSQKRQTIRSYVLKIQQNEKIIKQLTSQQVIQGHSYMNLQQIFGDIQQKMSFIDQSYLWPQDPRFDPYLAATMHSFFSRTLIAKGFFRTLEYRTAKLLQANK